MITECYNIHSCKHLFLALSVRFHAIFTAKTRFTALWSSGFFLMFSFSLFFNPIHQSYTTPLMKTRVLSLEKMYFIIVQTAYGVWFVEPKSAFQTCQGEAQIGIEWSGLAEIDRSSSIDFPFLTQKTLHTR